MLVPAALTVGGALALYPDSVYAKEKSPVDLNKVREAITEVIESDMEKRGDGTALYGTLL